MPNVTTKTMLLEALASNDRLAKASAEDIRMIDIAIEELPPFYASVRKAMSECEDNHLAALRQLRERMIARMNAMQDEGPVAQDGGRTSP